MATRNEAAKAIGVQEIATNTLRANPHNPRMLFDLLPMKVLEDSIRRVGILVPLTVYREARSGKFVILDGQRRWICAQRVGLNTVPVNNVAEPSLIQNIVTMFQIHKLREDWELMPTALKVELLMKELNDKNEARLAELTGLDVAVISRCKKLISFDRSYQDMMLDPDPAKRIKADFFIELYPVLHDREISKFDWFKPKKFTVQMLDKYLKEPRTLKAVTDFRIIKQHASNARKANKTRRFSRLLQEFADTPRMPLSHLEIDVATIHAEAKQIAKRVDAVRSTIEAIDVEQLYGEEGLWQALLELGRSIDQKLKDAGKKR